MSSEKIKILFSEITELLDVENKSSFFDNSQISFSLTRDSQLLEEIFFSSSLEELHFINDRVNNTRYLFSGNSEKRNLNFLLLRTFSGLDGQDEWKGIKGLEYIYPKYIFIETKFELKIISYETDLNLFKSFLKQLSISSNKESSLPKISTHHFIPNKENWMRNIEQCYNEFSKNSFQKLVMSRKVVLESSNDFNSKSIFQELTQNSKNSFDFFFHFVNQRFFGSTPETLFLRNKNNLITESLAGTRKRGINYEKDALLEQELLNDPKERSEQKYVTDEIVNRLNGISTKVDVGETRIKKLANLQHLQNEIHAVLKEDISNEDLIVLMHPTPAVGSLPLENGKEKIKEIENYDRGLYAGVISLNFNENSLNLVGIRSALSNESEKKLYLYSGAGIVNGSKAENEWEEINNKLRSFLSILNYDFKE